MSMFFFFQSCSIEDTIIFNFINLFTDIFIKFIGGELLKFLSRWNNYNLFSKSMSLILIMLNMPVDMIKLVEG